MKKSFGFAVAVMATFGIAAATFADDGEVRLIYPTDAAAAELDSSRPEKRIEPPVRELSEQDVLTPLGQVRAVITSLEDIRTEQVALRQAFETLKTADFARFAPALETIQKRQQEIETTVSTVAAQSRSLGEKIAKIPTIDDLNAFADKIQQTTETAERTVDKATRLAVFATLALVALIVIWKFGAIIAAKFKQRKENFAELMQALEIAKKQLAEERAAKQQTTETATDKAAAA